MEFQEISRDCINGRVRDNSAIYKDVPASHNKNNVNAKAIYLTEEKKYAPYLLCGYCTKTFVWYNFSKGKWVNQSGMSSVKLHQETCSKNESKPSTSTQQPLIEHCFAAVKSTETRNPLPWKLKKLWRDEVVDQLSENPTVFINACANLASAHANYAAEVIIRANTLYNWNIGRTYITDGIQEKGTSAHLQLKQLYMLFSHSEAADTCVSGIMDFWSGRHQQRVGYGVIIACGLTDEWKWFQFPLRLENLDEVPHDSEFTFKIFDEAFCSDVKPRYPFFVTTDNENKMMAASMVDGRQLITTLEVELVAQSMHCQRVSSTYSTLNQKGTADWN